MPPSDDDLTESEDDKAEDDEDAFLNLDPKVPDLPRFLEDDAKEGRTFETVKKRSRGLRTAEAFLRPLFARDPTSYDLAEFRRAALCEGLWEVEAAEKRVELARGASAVTLTYDLACGRFLYVAFAKPNEMAARYSMLGCVVEKGILESEEPPQKRARIE